MEKLEKKEKAERYGLSEIEKKKETSKERKKCRRVLWLCTMEQASEYLNSRRRAHL